uniref:Uncharacterized protein n=1 Tax=Rhizophora mucronata TaxID=61149 RepID=A0A2P2PDP8_RHIMU
MSGVFYSFSMSPRKITNHEFSRSFSVWLPNF